MAKVRNISRWGGWTVRIITPGRPSSERLFFVYEFNRSSAVELARAKVPARPGELCEAVARLDIHTLVDSGMKSGDVKAIRASSRSIPLSKTCKMWPTGARSS